MGIIGKFRSKVFGCPKAKIVKAFKKEVKPNELTVPQETLLNFDVLFKSWESNSKHKKNNGLGVMSRKFAHKANCSSGKSGSPIVLRESGTAIGVHHGGLICSNLSHSFNIVAGFTPEIIKKIESLK
eukprot:TRINITY_DN23205_c0_g1_i1.p1 TRINITY_DN23205_c0_g1~~TRINITY_DN23205_c0_g1_i1.p1  ORF type:complete len:134 (-),score=30.50 TRINITY_DN23205_c0_g1_i1:148-528(-)